MSRKNIPNKPKPNPYEIAEKLDCDPFQVLVWFIKADWKSLGYESANETKYTSKGEMYEAERLTPELRLSAAKDAVKYLYAQHKAVEHSIEEGTKLLAPIILRATTDTT